MWSIPSVNGLSDRITKLTSRKSTSAMESLMFSAQSRTVHDRRARNAGFVVKASRNSNHLMLASRDAPSEPHFPSFRLVPRNSKYKIHESPFCIEYKQETGSGLCPL